MSQLGDEKKRVWRGALIYGNDTRPIQIIMSHENEIVEGNLFIADPVTEEWVDFGPLSGTLKGDRLQAVNLGGLELEGVMTATSLIGTVVFLRIPDIRDEGTAQMILSRQFEVYLPIIRR